jgi:hypothetical protein
MLPRSRKAPDEAEVVRALEKCCEGFNNPPQFRSFDIFALMHCLELYERRPWPGGVDVVWRQELQNARAEKAACDRTIALLQESGKNTDAEQETAAQLDGYIKWIEGFRGRGKKPPRGWAIMARRLGDLMLMALRHAYELEGRQPRRGYGSVTGPLFQFIEPQLQRYCEQTGESLPESQSILDAMNRKP